VLSALRLLVGGEPVPLPEPLAGPLHFPSPPSCAWLLVWFLLVAGLLFWLGRLLWRRLRRASAARGARPAPPPRRRRAASGIGAAIAAILDRHLRSATYRRGCHELSAALRTHWEEGGLGQPAGPRFTRMTAREIGGRLGDRPATRLLSVLSDLQFGRRGPTREDFQGACDLAAELVSKGGGG
jgi:hypothetical protein